MKVSLRNLLVAGAVMFAGSAFAQSTMYLTGDGSCLPTDVPAWDPFNCVEVVAGADGYCVYEFPSECEPMFKISSTKGAEAGDWTGFNSNSYNVMYGNELTQAGEYTLEPSTDAFNITLPKGNWTIKVNLSDCHMIVEGVSTAPVGALPTFYYRGSIRGDNDGWNDGKVELVATGAMVDGLAEMVGYIEGGLNAQDEFKIANDNWSKEYVPTDGSIYPGRAVDMQQGGNNAKIMVPVMPNAKVTFYYSETATCKLQIEAVSEVGAINDIIAEDASAAVYYNLQGVKVANPAAGNLYIKVAGKKATKVVF